MKLFRKKADRFKPISLAYRAPVLPEIFTKLDSPPVFYNAFPDLNDQATDGSYSAYPKGAKYLLPLACTFNPYSAYKWIDPTDPLTTLPGYELLKAEYNPDSPHCYERFSKACDPALELESNLSDAFELTHCRLAAVAYKQMFRANLLGPFYETLYDFFLSGKNRSPSCPQSEGLRAATSMVPD
jgi:hypothetical protein